MKKLILFFVFTMSIEACYSQCSNNNIFYENIAAPTTLGGIVSTELYGGEYSKITGLVKGNTYTITTCGNTDFDTQITLFKAGANSSEAFNDDFGTCTNSQSAIIFTPFSSGNYDIVIDEYPCSDNFSEYTEVFIELSDNTTDVLTIPVVVHVLYNATIENISDNQINSQIDVLNEDFRRINSDISGIASRFRGFSADSKIEFCLASMDPDGNPTDGIIRVETDEVDFTGTDAMKFTSQGGSDAWNTSDYLNIWACNLGGGLLGFAQFPGSGPVNTDGVVIGYDKFGRVGTLSPPYDGGRTATHEVGHWLNLFHIWGDGDCSMDDEVADTPIQGEENGGCPSDPTSCSNGGLGGDMSVNYMDYVDDDCMGMFTYLQSIRMSDAINDHRSGLASSEGCSTGTGPDADFKANVTQGYAPLTVNFTDLSSNQPDSWNWSFNGSNTPNSSIQNPSNITYNDPGSYSVTLISDNGWGSDQETKFNYIEVLPKTANGIEENSMSTLKSWPNPAQIGNPIHVSIEENITSFEAYNSLGQKIEVVRGVKKNQFILKTTSPGSYIVRLKSESEEFLSIVLLHE